jgi:hypothetical protein
MNSFEKYSRQLRSNLQSLLELLDEVKQDHEDELTESSIGDRSNPQIRTEVLLLEKQRLSLDILVEVRKTSDHLYYLQKYQRSLK